MKKRVIVDSMMAVILPVLMAYSLIGTTLHEWIGAAMFLLFITHHILNRKWFVRLRRGTYTRVRKMNTAIDILLLLIMLLMMASAMIISQHVFVFLGLGGAASIGRVIHLAGANWGFVLMSLHLGLHGSMLTGKLGLEKDKKSARILRAVIPAIAAYGALASAKRGLWSYLFLKQFYAEFDRSEPVILFLLDYLAIMLLFAVIAFCAVKILAQSDRNRARRERAAVLEDPEKEAERQRLLQEKKRKNRLIRRLVLAGLILAAGLLWGIPYGRRHYYTVRIDRSQATAMDPVELGGKTLIIQFTRTGNTDFVPDVDAVSSASLMLDENGQLVGNAELLAEMVQNATGGDLYAIRVARPYSSSYGDTVSEAGEELRADTLPVLLKEDGLPEIGDYDRIILVFPLWWSTVPKPVEAFLVQADWSGKMVDLILTHGGGGKGTVPRDLAVMLPGGTLNENILLIYDDDADEAAPAVADWLKSIK